MGGIEASVFLETALKPLRLKVKFTEIPANWVARTEGESQNSFWENFKYFRIVFKVRFAKRSIIKEYLGRRHTLKYLILGAGPAGLAVANRLKELGETSFWFWRKSKRQEDYAGVQW